MSWIKVTVKEYYQDDPRSCSTQYRTIPALMCPYCKKKLFPITNQLREARFCPTCGELVK